MSLPRGRLFAEVNRRAPLRPSARHGALAAEIRPQCCGSPFLVGDSRMRHEHRVAIANLGL